MHVSTEVRRREPVERPTDPTTYAAATGAGNFLAMLAEMTRPPEKTESEATPSENVSEAPIVETDSAQNAETGATDAKDSASVEESGTSGETPNKTTTESTGEPTSEGAGSAATTDTAATPDTTSSVPEPKAAQAGTTPGGTTATAPQPTIAEPLVVTAALVPESEDVIAKLTDSAAARVVSAGGESAEVTVDATVEPEVPAPPPASFPKTLNALIAEEAVRQMPDTEGAASPGTEVNTPELTELPTGLDVEQLPMPEESQPVALPRAAALETAGVRPEMSGAPRVPLANLPGNLAQQINLMQQEGSRTMRIRLAPEHLGELQIEIQGSGDALRVRLTSSVPAVREALENQMTDLKDALQKQGIALDQATVDGESARRHAPEEKIPPQPAPSMRLTRESPPPARAATPLQPIAGSAALNLLV